MGFGALQLWTSGSRINYIAPTAGIEKIIQVSGRNEKIFNRH